MSEYVVDLIFMGLWFVFYILVLKRSPTIGEWAVLMWGLAYGITWSHARHRWAIPPVKDSD